VPAWLAHALDKHVVLVCSRANQHDVPFDLQHIRVIYYDVTDPFWGSKLIEKIAENVLSAVKSPEEARIKSALELNERASFQPVRTAFRILSQGSFAWDSLS
jgi:hypothetical protein